jgi:hypothetical protein
LLHFLTLLAVNLYFHSQLGMSSEKSCGLKESRADLNAMHHDVSIDVPPS